MKKQTLITALAVTALFAASASASAGGYDPDLDADIIDNQMVGLEPTGRTLTAEELASGPFLDADGVGDHFAQEASGTVVNVFDFEYGGENQNLCPSM